MNVPSNPMSKIRAYAVHCYTASGIFPAAAALVELTKPTPNIQWVFGYLLLTTFIDATDGPLARRFEVKKFAGSIDGRTIDDLLDYLTFALIPLLVVYRMGWLADAELSEILNPQPPMAVYLLATHPTLQPLRDMARVKELLP